MKFIVGLFVFAVLCCGVGFAENENSGLIVVDCAKPSAAVKNQQESEATEFIFDGTSKEIVGSVVENRSQDWRKRASMSSRGSMIAGNAKRYLGVPYAWGGTTPAGFDCSGFVMSVYKATGLNIDRMADSQYYAGQKISKEELMVGDLVFFSTYAPGVSHVGIYLGNDTFIHASSSRGVTIDSLSSPYYSSRYVGACRY